MLQRLILLLSLLYVVIDMQSQQWLIEYPSRDNETAYFIVGDMSGEYNYSIGYKYDERGTVFPLAVCIDKEGNYIDKIYDKNIVKGYFSSVVGIGDGNAFVVGRCGENVANDTYEKLWFAIIGPDLEIIHENIVEIESPYVSYGYTSHTLINDKNEFVVVTQVADGDLLTESVHYDYAFYRINGDCDLLESLYLENTSDYADITDFVLIPNTNDYAVFGNGMNVNGVESVFYVDGDLNYIATEFVDDPKNYPNLLFPKFMCVDHCIDENSFLMSMQSSATTGMNKWCPLVLKMDREMRQMGMLRLERRDTTDYVSQFRSMAYVDANTIYVSTYSYRGDMEDEIPNVVTIYLINENLDLLGRKDIDIGKFFNVFHIQPTHDKACIVQGYVYDEERKKPIICKLFKNGFEITTNVSDNEEALDVTLYPNPVSSLLNISVECMKGKVVNVKLYDVLGKKYLDKDILFDGNALTIDVSSLEKGTYYYCLYDKENCVKNVFVKE